MGKRFWAIRGEILRRAKAVKYISPVELNFKIPIRTKFPNSQSPAEPENFELPTLNEDKTFFPNGVQNFNP